MTNIHCVKCNEPYDTYHIRHDVTATERKRFLAGDVCDVCAFGTTCPPCAGGGRSNNCESCLGGGLIRVVRLIKPVLGALDPGIHCSWHVEHSGTPPQYIDEATIKRMGTPYTCADGLVLTAWAICPDCPEDSPTCAWCAGDGSFTTYAKAVAAGRNVGEQGRFVFEAPVNVAQIKKGEM